MEKKVKRLENLIENMLQTHYMQMDKIIKLVAEIKEERQNKGKLDSKKIKIKSIDYLTDGDE